MPQDRRVQTGPVVRRYSAGTSLGTALTGGTVLSGGTALMDMASVAVS